MNKEINGDQDTVGWQKITTNCIEYEGDANKMESFSP